MARPFTPTNADTAADSNLLPASLDNDGSTPSALPWRLLAREAAWLWLAWQAMILALTYVALTFSPNAETHPHAAVATPAAFVSAWVRHDSAWYLRIASDGYNAPGTLAFFPLYPLLIHLFTPLCLGNAPLAAVLVARLAAYPAFLGMLALAWQELGPRLSSARLALAMTLAYPLAFFFAAAYTEPLFLALAAFTLLFARRHAWAWAALFGVLAGLSRPSGLLLFLPLTWEWARVARPWVHWREWRVWRKGALALGAVPAAYLVMVLLSWLYAGSPLAFITVHASFDRVKLPPWEVARLLVGVLYRSSPGSFIQARNLSDVGPVLVVLLVVALGLYTRRMPVSFALYTVGLVVLSIASPTPILVDPFVSTGRFLTAAIPVFLLLAAWAQPRPWLAWLLIGGGLWLQAILAAFYLNGGWLI
ncbi:MAG TPA: mannosyltransferase family protein [Ktedonobacterales bacterium]|nr:mannosyltransferase family protein [Ktedonobacterales bacterium]